MRKSDSGEVREKRANPQPMKGGRKNPGTTNKSKDAAEVVRWPNEKVPRVTKGRKAGIWRAVEVLGEGGRKNTPGEIKDPGTPSMQRQPGREQIGSASVSRLFNASWAHAPTASAAVFTVPGQVLTVFATHHEPLLPRLLRGFRGIRLVLLSRPCITNNRGLCCLWAHSGNAPITRVYPDSTAAVATPSGLITATHGAPTA